MRRLLWLAAAACASCSDEPPAPRVWPSADVAAPSAIASVRTASRVYYLAHRDDDECVLYWMENGGRSVDKPIVCPDDLDPGEKMRLAGRTCMRETDKPERNLPVRCPKHIIYAERDDIRGFGEFKLKAQN